MKGSGQASHGFWLWDEQMMLKYMIFLPKRNCIAPMKQNPLPLTRPPPPPLLLPLGHQDPPSILQSRGDTFTGGVFLGYLQLPIKGLLTPQEPFPHLPRPRNTEDAGPDAGAGGHRATLTSTSTLSSSDILLHLLRKRSRE